MPADTLAGQFPETEWTLILAAGTDTSRSAPALEQLCGSYWQPLYAFARRKGHAPEAAEDAVQGFIHTIIARQSLGNVERDGRRFRSWLLGGFTHHLANLYRHDQTKRRGGGSLPISIEEAEAALPADASLTPDEAYDRRWAQLVLLAATAKLREHQQRIGKGETYEVLEPLVTMQTNSPYATAAARLGISEQAVTLQVHRLRQKLRDFTRAEVARTVMTEEELEDEFRHLLATLRKR